MQADDEVNLVELLSDIWRQRVLVICCVAVFVLGAIFYLNVATYAYTAELRVTPAQPSQLGKGKTAGLSGLASVAGLSLGRDPGTMSFDLYTESLKSRDVAEKLAGQRDLMKVVFAGEWDERTKSFREPPAGLVAMISRTLKSILGIPVYAWQPPSAARLQEYIESNVKTKEAIESPVVSITLEHPDPEFAVKFLNQLHHALDDNLRTKALVRSTEYIDYLSDQLRRVTIVEHRSAIAEMLSEQEKTKMMASSSLAFAADQFGPVTASLRPTSPRPSIVLALSIVLGTLAGILAALLRTQVRNYRRTAAPVAEPIDA